MDVLRELFYLAITLIIIGVLLAYALGLFGDIKNDAEKLFQACLIIPITCGLWVKKKVL